MSALVLSELFIASFLLASVSPIPWCIFTPYTSPLDFHVSIRHLGSRSSSPRPSVSTFSLTVTPLLSIDFFYVSFSLQTLTRNASRVVAPSSATSLHPRYIGRAQTTFGCVLQSLIMSPSSLFPLGRGRYHPHNPGPEEHAEDDLGSDGRNHDDERWELD